MPSPPGLTQLQNLFFARRFIKDPRGPIEECTARYGLVWQSLVPSGKGLTPLYWLMGRDGNERVLSPKYKEDFTWYEGYRFTMEPLFGRQILFLLDDEPGESGEHRERQRLLVSAFHPRLDAQYLATMEAIVEKHLDALPVGEPLDMQWAIKRLTFHLIARLLLGAEEKDLTELTHRFEDLGLGLFSLVHLPIPGLPFHRARRARTALDRYLQARLKLYRSGSESAPPMLAGLLAAASEQGASISDEAIIAELISFLYAGYDTTSSLLTSIVVALGENPAVYGRLCEALRHSSAAADCPYLDAVLLEGERLYPPALFLLRGVRRDFSYAGFDIKAGSKLAYSPYYTHRMAELYPQPLSFRPERFLDQSGAVSRPSPYALVGFGGGHRMCIGKRLAGLEMRLFLLRLLRRFEIDFLPQQKNDLYFNPALQRRYGYTVRLKAAAGGA